VRPNWPLIPVGLSIHYRASTRHLEGIQDALGSEAVTRAQQPPSTPGCLLLLLGVVLLLVLQAIG
jgi:hypothetical protein